MNINGKIFFVFILLLTFSLNAQLAQEGMSIKENNYTHFNEKIEDNFQSWKKYNTAEFYKHPDFGVLPSKSPKKNVVEDLSKRTAESRYFVDIDQPSVFYIQKGLFPINYLDDNGHWRTIETGLAPLENQIYESKYYYEPAGFDLNQAHSYIKTIAGKVDFNQWSLYKRVGGQIEFISKPNWSDYTVGEDGIYINNIFEGIDAEMEIQKGAIKTNFVMKSNEHGVFDELIFRDAFQSNQALDVSFAENPNNNRQIGAIEIKKAGEPVLKIHEGFAYMMSSSNEAIELMYSINNQKVDVIVPFSWIDENIKNGVLIIDPLVTGVGTITMANILGSMYNTSCNFTNSCNYDMLVSFPPYATVTNATSDFDYNASGLCSMGDGATRFSSGSCLSPAGTGYFWYCNSISPGTCSGDDVPIYSDLASCMPSPSCTAQDIPFQLQFFRGCYGSTGCSNDCIAAHSDWVVTVTGATVDFSNLASTINISSTSICLGQTVVASTQGEYGAPPYTFNWSFSPSGSPSIGSTISENIVFPNPGSHKLYVSISDNCNQIVSDSIEVEVIDTIVPTFNIPDTYCKGELVTLPTMSDNGIPGSWTPTFNTNTPGTATYTFSSGGCSPDVEKEITILPSPYGSISQSVQACERDSELPEIIFTGGNTNAPYTFLYTINGDTMQVSSSNGENSTSITVPTDTSGVFIINLIHVSDNICINTVNSTATVTVYEAPIADFNASTYFGELDTEISFENNSDKETAINWFHFMDSTTYWGSLNDFDHVFIESGEHLITLIAENDHCSDSITKVITILPREPIYNLPNVFTPNGDGSNDVLEFDFDNVQDLDLVVLNRWGSVVFQTNDQNESWNGKLNNSGEKCEDGVYFYRFKVKGFSGDDVEEHGFVHLFNE